MRLGAIHGKHPMATDYIARLQAIPLFSELDEEELAYVSSIVKTGRCSGGEVVFHEGDESDKLYIVDTGQVSVFRQDPAGLQVIVRLLGPGRFFGETGVLRGEPRNATVRANTNTTFFIIEKENCEEMMERLPSVRKQLEAAASRRASPLHRFKWQFPDEVAIGVAHRNIIPMIFESRGLLLALIGAALFALPFLPILVVWDLAPWLPWLLRIGGLTELCAVILWYIHDWTNDYLVVTNQRIVHVERRGLLSVTRSEIPIHAVRNVELSRQGILAVLLGLSDIIIDAIGAKMVFAHVSNGEYLQERILDQRTLAEQEARREEFDAIRQELLRVLPAEVVTQPPPSQVQAAAQPSVQVTPKKRRWLEWLDALRPHIRQERGDEIIWHKHWLVLLWRLALPSGVFVAGAVLAIALWLLSDELGLELPRWTSLMAFALASMAAAIMGWWGYALWDQDLYILTSDDRIVDIERHPLRLRETRRESNVDRIQDIDVSINIWGRIFDMGDVYIKTGAAGSDLTFHSVAHPRSIQRDIFHRLAEVRRRTQEYQRRQHFEEMAKWFAVYSQLTTRVSAPREVQSQAEESEPSS